MVRFKLTIPARAESLPYLDLICEGIMQKLGFKSDETKKMKLAIEEAAINTVKHAYSSGEEGQIECMIDIFEKKFAITLTDFGKGIETSGIRVYDINDENSITSESGRGFYLMNVMTDEFELESVPQQGTRIYLAKRLKEVDDIDS